MLNSKRDIDPDRYRPTLECGEGLTKQAHKDECDINRIINRYQTTGYLPVSGNEPLFMEVDEIDFQTAMDMVTNAQTQFDQLPSEIRKRFANSPAEFLDFVHNPENIEEMYDLGLANRPPPQEQATSASPDQPISHGDQAEGNVGGVSEGH